MNKLSSSRPGRRRHSDDIRDMSLSEFSRVTGVRIELLRRFLNRKARDARTETWDKIYLALKPHLLGPEPAQEPPPRIGPPYRRHHDLIAMESDQKVLLDEFAVLPDPMQRSFTESMLRQVPDAAASEYAALTPAENRIMGVFLALDAEGRSRMIRELTRIAIAEVRRRRAELF